MRKLMNWICKRNCDYSDNKSLLYFKKIMNSFKRGYNNFENVMGKSRFRGKNKMFEYDLSWYGLFYVLFVNVCVLILISMCVSVWYKTIIDFTIIKLITSIIITTITALVIRHYFGFIEDDNNINEDDI